MRDAAGFGRLKHQPATATTPEAWGIEFQGLRNGPAALVLPDGFDPGALTPFDNQIVEIGARLVAIAGENLTRLALLATDIQPPAEDNVVTPLFVIATGNLGQKPSPNPSGTSVTAGLAIATTDGSGDSAWLRLQVSRKHPLAAQLETLEPGTPVIAFGRANTFRYTKKDTPGEQADGFNVELRRIELLPRTGRPDPVLSYAPPLETSEATS